LKNYEGINVEKTKQQHLLHQLHHHHHHHHHRHRQRRSNLDIIAIILELVLSGVRNRNKINYKARLAYKQLNSFLQIIFVNGLLDMNQTIEETSSNEKVVFKLTAKGFRFLELYRSLNAQLIIQP
jgi:predicted transcriptional regulator